MIADELWMKANCLSQIRPAEMLLHRIVESQEKVATMTLVDSFEEQSLLEEMLEESKPPAPTVAKGLDYLLMTPFRYPPLKYGSRFGRAHERGIFYGSLELPTALCECAYYRFVFCDGLVVPFTDTLITHHTVFQVNVNVERHIDLTALEFSELQSALMSKSDYSLPQRLGSLMRESDVGAFQFFSARVSDGHGKNAGVFDPLALVPPVKNKVAWICQTSASEIRFFAEDGSVGYSFRREQFLVAEKLPMPAVSI